MLQVLTLVIPFYTVLAVCAAPRLGSKQESICLMHSLMWEQWSAFWQTKTCCGHINNSWNVCPILLWCNLWNSNAQQTCKIIQLMVICVKSTMVVAIAFNIRSHTLILNLMYDTNMRLLKMLYDIWYGLIFASLILKWMIVSCDWFKQFCLRIFQRYQQLAC